MTEATAHAHPDWSAEIEIDPPFHDIDPMEVVWHGHYLKYFEIARCALLDRIDYNYPQMKASGYAWPIIDVQIRYSQALRFAQRARVTARIVEWEHRLKIQYRIVDAQTGRKLTTASTVQVAVDIASGELQMQAPAVLLRKLGLPTSPTGEPACSMA